MLPGFANPLGALLLLLLIPLIIFYFLKLRRPRMDLPSLALWRQVMADQRVNSPFQKFKRNLLLLLQILLLLSLVGAVTQPFLSGNAERAEYLPVLIDTSASMEARDQAGGKTRLEVAKERVGRLVENLLPDQRLCLIAVDSSARRLTDFTDNRRMLTAALNGLAVSQTASRLEDGLRLAQALARANPVKKVILISDGNVPAMTDFELPFDLDFQKLDPGGANVGITDFNARRTSNGWDVFVRVESAAATQGVVELMLRQGEGEVARRTLSVTPLSSERVVFRLESAEAASLVLQLKPDGFDSLPADNVAYLDLPRVRPLTVYCPESLTTYRHALSIVKDIRLYPGEEAAPASVDLKIVDSSQETGPEADVTLLVGVVPSDLSALLEVTTGLADVVDWIRTTPLLQHVQLRDVQIADSPQLVEGVEEREIEAAGYEILAQAKDGPLILQSEDATGLKLWLLFHTDRSSLPYRVGFPIMVSNAVQLAWQRSGLAEVRSLATGTLPPIPAPAEQMAQVVQPGGGRESLRVSGNGLLTGVSARQSGSYQILIDGNEFRRVGVSLMSPSETRLEAVDKLQFPEVSVSASAEAVAPADVPLWSWLAAIGLVVLLVEWWYFQKRPAGLPA